MIVHVNACRDTSARCALADVHPTHQLPGTIHDHLVPDLSFLFDLFPVAQQPDIGEVGGDWIELLEYLAWQRHPGLVNERVGDLVLA